MKKIIISTVIIYLLIIIQTSFLAHFKFLYYLPNLVIVFVILLNLFESQQEKTGLIISAIAGFLLDAFLEKPFGFYTIILVAASLVIKAIIKKYLYLKLSK